jgi:hypothetical protein
MTDEEHDDVLTPNQLAEHVLDYLLRGDLDEPDDGLWTATDEEITAFAGLIARRAAEPKVAVALAESLRWYAQAWVEAMTSSSSRINPPRWKGLDAQRQNDQGGP